jgi:hypothetical protein
MKEGLGSGAGQSRLFLKPKKQRDGYFGKTGLQEYDDVNEI